MTLFQNIYFFQGHLKRRKLIQILKNLNKGENLRHFGNIKPKHVQKC